MGNLRRLLLLLFFLSGFSALVYEVVWARQLSLVFGTTSFAISSILAVFFSGLALGSYLFGRLVDAGTRIQANEKRIIANEQRPLLIYGLLELGIGLYAAGTPWIFKLIEGLQVSFWQRWEPTYFGFSLFTFGLSFLGLILPTTLMGGTLPVLSKFWLRREEEVGSGVGALYFINTLGATVGAFLAGFWLITAIGVKETIWAAAFINLLIGIIVVYLSRMKANAAAEGGLKRIQTNERISSLAPLRSKFVSISILAAYAAAGFAALSLEVLWTRVLILFYGGSVYAFTTVLVVFLIGIAMGSFVASGLLQRWEMRIKANDKRIGANERMLVWFGVIVIVLGVAVIASLPLFNQMPFWLLEILKEARGSFGTVVFWEFGLSFLIMFVPTFLMGFIFPLGVKIYMRINANKERIYANERIGKVGRSVGVIYAVNTLGGIVGSLTAGFLLIPLIGTQKGIWLAGTLYLLVGGGIFFLIKLPKFTRLLMSFFIVLLILIGFYLPSWNKHFLVSGPFANWRFFVFDTPKQAEKRMQASELLFYKEGIEATVAVKKSGEQIFLRINGKTDAATGLDMDTQILSGQLPMLLHPNPEDVLVIGLGSGITLGSVEQHPLATVEAVEIEPAMVEAAKYFDEANFKALEDKRLKMVVGDGRHYLLATQKKYDVITSEPSNVWLSGNSKLFTKEYFQLAKTRLKERGIFAHWIQLYNLQIEDLKIAIKTFQAVFPYTTVWDNLSSYDLLLIGSTEPQEFDLSLLEEKFKEEKVKNDLTRIFINNPTQFLTYLALNDEGVLKYTQGAKENTDNHPILEFSAPKTLYQATISKNMESTKDLRPDLFPKDSLWQKYYQARKHITMGKMYFTRGEQGRAVAEYEEALKIDPENQWLKLTLERKP